jgi:hypothetical protein
MATYGAVPAAGGHAHGGGGMRKAKRSEQDEVGLASITHMGKCEDAIPIKKGDKLRVSANFDLVKHPL